MKKDASQHRDGKEFERSIASTQKYLDHLLKTQDELTLFLAAARRRVKEARSFRESLDKWPTYPRKTDS